LIILVRCALREPTTEPQKSPEDDHAPWIGEISTCSTMIDLSKTPLWQTNSRGNGMGLLVVFL